MPTGPMGIIGPTARAAAETVVEPQAAAAEEMSEPPGTAATTEPEEEQEDAVGKVASEIAAQDGDISVASAARHQLQQPQKSQYETPLLVQGYTV